ncbi:MAG: hypothetical protein ABIS47_10615, partial [Acidimicrobiales bacterium]
MRTSPEIAGRPGPQDVVGRDEAAPRRRLPERPPLAWLAGLVALLGVLSAWLALRPASPRGAAAVVDLLVLPAVLGIEARLLAGRSGISATGLSILFGLGAVLAPGSALLLEWLASFVLSASALGAFGSLVEVVAPAGPVVIVAALLLNDGRRPTVVDLALAGLASGLGVLVVQSSLVAAASHLGPRYVSPLVAGWQRIQLGGGAASIHLVGPAVTTALLGLGLGAAVRWRTRLWRLFPLALVICLTVLDRAVYDRQLRYATAGQLAPSNRLADIVSRLTFSGRVELVLVVLGLGVFGRVEGTHLWNVATRPLRLRSGPSSSRREMEPGPDQDADQPDDRQRTEHGHADASGDVERTQADPGEHGERPQVGPAAPPDDADAEQDDHARPEQACPPAPAAVAHAAVTLGLALSTGVVFVVLARTRHLGFLQDRGAALAVSVAGFAYSLLRLAAMRAPGAAPPAPEDDHGDGAATVRLGDGIASFGDEAAAPTGDEHAHASVEEVVAPSDEGRQMLCLAAIAASALGIAFSDLGSPTRALPPGSLVVDAVQGWAAHVGHPGLLLGLGGLAAPPGPVVPQSRGGWWDLLPWRIRSSGWARGLSPRGHRLGWSRMLRLRSLGWPGLAGWSGRRGLWRLLPGRAGGEAHGDGTSARLGWRGFWRLRSGAVGDGARAGRSSGGLPWRMGRWRPIAPLGEPEGKLPTTTIRIEPVDEWERSRVEFEGATVQEAMQAALGHLDVGLSRTSLQLVDVGVPAKPGKPDSGRPARVRVIHGRDDAPDPFLPPGRDSISRTCALAVVVELVDEASAVPPSAVDAVSVVTAPGAGPPPTIDVLLTNATHTVDTRVLTCSREEASPGTVRYRSNPYRVDAGEDLAWARGGATVAEGLKIRDGEQLRAEHAGQAAVITVYDGWARQVLGVNAELFDITSAHHVTDLAVRERQGTVDDDRAARLIRAGLAAVEEGRQIHSSLADDDQKAFLGTALLHRAMTLDIDGDAVLDAAAAALAEH